MCNGQYLGSIKLTGVAIDETIINSNATKDDYLTQALVSSKEIVNRFPK